MSRRVARGRLEFVAVCARPVSGERGSFADSSLAGRFRKRDRRAREVSLSRGSGFRGAGSEDARGQGDTRRDSAAVQAVDLDRDRGRPERGGKGVEVSEQSLSRRRGGDEKKAAVYLARQLTRLGGREVGAAFGVKAARVSHICGSIQKNSSSALARRIAALQRRIEST